MYTSYVRSKLEFGSVIWDPYQEVYRDDIESVQKQFVMYALGDTYRVPPYRLLPYEYRCEKLGLETLRVRRTKMNLMFAYDIYNNRFNDVNFSNKLVRVEQYHLFRFNRLLHEETYHSQYSYFQPIAKMIRLINKFSQWLTLSRTVFKNDRRIREKLSELREEEYEM